MKVHHRLDGPDGAPVLVLANSLGTELELWSRNVPRWQGSFRVLRYDLRGHGATPVSPEPFGVDDLGRDVLELLDDLGIGRVSFCGLSLGGAIGQWLATNEPGRIERLVLACTTARFGEPEQWLQRAAKVRAEGVEAIADSVVARWFTPAMADEDVAAYREMLIGTPAEGYAAACEALARWDFRDRVGKIRTPTLVIVGGADPVTASSDVELLTGGIPNARLVVLDGAAHLANVERPDAFGAAVSEHLALQEAA
ncbi:MAG TPA: 3-oxoadipate enol-lactonase [Gaiellaceae bacterium]|nr:3-oxoadipate enol-lactonase [Gaiellaceae bacterium]